MARISPSGAPDVLIVDDQPRNLDVLESMLSPLGCRLVRATSADEALLALLRHEFAAIVLDIQMPGMSGIELAQLIKQRKRSEHVPILFLTAHLMDEADALRGYGVGGVDYISKPINADILRSKVAVFVDLFTKTRALAELNEALRREVAERERAQQELQQVNEELERRVQERTAALTRAHQGVRENEERLRLAMDVGRIAAWEWQLQSGEMTWSTDPEQLFGFPEGAFGAERRMARAIHPDDRPHLEQAVAGALDTGTYEADYRAIRPDGSVAWITERGQLLAEADGLTGRLVGVSRDVTAERQAASEREQLLKHAREARDEAERHSRLKDEFLATLSHELRTPMNAILGWLAILDTGKPIRDIHSALAVIRRNSEMQAKLIEDLLDMNRLVSGNVQLELGPVDLGALSQATMQALQPAAEAKGVQLLAVVDPGPPLRGDARRLQQVLWNLVHNAIKFTPPGGRVEIQVQRHPDRLELAVADTGQGISSTFLPHVFERFRQEDSSSTRESAGLGLGLSIARHLVELHGGTIEATSDGPGRGARFTVALRSGSAASTGEVGAPPVAARSIGALPAGR